MLKRDRLDAAVQVVGPAVIAALKFAGVAFVRRHDHRAAMSALIMKRVYLPTGATNYDDGLRRQLGAEIVALIFDLAFMADVYPGAAKDAFKLKIEDRGIGIQPAMNAGGLHEAGQVIAHA